MPHAFKTANGASFGLVVLLLLVLSVSLVLFMTMSRRLDKLESRLTTAQQETVVEFGSAASN